MMTKDSIEALVRVITEEIVRGLEKQGNFLSAAALPCPWCAQACGGRCSGEVNHMVRLGADRVSAAAPDFSIEKGGIAGIIDHTLLKPNALYEEIRKVCEEAKQHGFASVCINPALVGMAAKFLAGSTVKVCTVAGFPLGATFPEVKAFEAECSILNGAQEIDMVINIGALKSKDFTGVERDIRMVTEVCHARQALCKVIIETAYLTEEEKISACSLAKACNADFVKTSTGFGPSGASAQDVALMKSVVGAEMGIKAAGGVRDWKSFQEMLQSGATRIGASASVKILQEAKSQNGGAQPSSSAEKPSLGNGRY